MPPAYYSTWGDMSINFFNNVYVLSSFHRCPPEYFIPPNRAKEMGGGKRSKISIILVGLYFVLSGWSN